MADEEMEDAADVGNLQQHRHQHQHALFGAAAEDDLFEEPLQQYVAPAPPRAFKQGALDSEDDD